MGERYELSIEVLDGRFPASAWQHAYGDVLVRTALEHGCVEWRWHTHSWGVVLELAFPDEADSLLFRDAAGVRAALDAVPNGVVVKRGWGGTSGSWEPRRPRPFAGAGAAGLPEPRRDEATETRALVLTG